MNAIVDGNDGLARHQRRQHVVGGVKQVDPLSPKIQRHADLFAERIVAGPFRDGPEVVPEALERRNVWRLAEKHVLSRLVDPREMSQQVPDIGTYAVVPEFASVDGDSRGHGILGPGNSPLTRR